MNNLDKLKAWRDAWEGYEGKDSDSYKLIDWAVRQIEQPDAWYPDAQNITDYRKVIGTDGRNVTDPRKVISSGEVEPKLDEVQKAMSWIDSIMREEHRKNNKSLGHQEFITEYRQELHDIEQIILRALRQYSEPPYGDYDGAIVCLWQCNP